MARNFWLGIGVTIASSGCAAASLSVDDVSQGVEADGSSRSTAKALGCPVSGGHSVTLQGAAVVSDARIDGLHKTTNYGADPDLIVRKNVSALLRWDLQNIPPNAKITGACLVLTVQDPSVRTFEAYAVARPWTATGATWKSAAHGSAWARAGASHTSDRGELAVATFQRSTSGLFGTPLATELVQKWVSDAASNNGIAITNRAAHDGISFTSSEAPVGPALMVFYDAP